jgi:hypothetical protein
MAAVAVLAGTLAVLVATSSFGRDGGSGPADRKLHPRQERLVSASRGGGTAAAARGVKVRYLESDATAIGPGASDGFSFTCPKRTPRAVTGYGGSAQAAQAGDIVIADSTPFRKGRSWSVGVKNLSAQPREFYVGVVCVG